MRVKQLQLDLFVRVSVCICMRHFTWSQIAAGEINRAILFYRYVLCMFR